MRVVVSGSHGLIGSALVPHLRSAGDEVGRLVRGTPEGPGDVFWDPAGGAIDQARLAGVDAVVHLAGEGIGDRRWSAAHKRRVLESRVRGTRLVSEALAELDPRPRVLVSSSGVHYYGDRGDEAITEESPPGTGFLADVCRQWEQATAPAEEAGIRVVHLRTAMVLSPRGGALKKQLTPFRLGVGGRLGSGRQYWSWISIDDQVGAITHILSQGPGADALSGPVNATAPDPVTNAEFTRVLARVLGRPALLPVPRLALVGLFGAGMTDEMLLSGFRVLPTRLLASGYHFRFPELEGALRVLLRGGASPAAA